MDGFSYRGVHCCEFGIGYIPGPAERMLNYPEFKQYEEDVKGRDGAYYYGNNVNVRDFELDCYVEKVSTEDLEKMYQWLHRDYEGKLVFDNRPFVYYEVRPSKPPKGNLYPTTEYCNSTGVTLWSGTLTLYFKGYEPHGKMSYIFYEETDVDNAKDHCGILPRSKMPSQISPQAGSYLVYNPGTEKTNTVIRIAGHAPNGVTITNNTTNEKCTLLHLPANTDWLEIDGNVGGVYEEGSNPHLAFEYHEEGYITLAPCVPYCRDISATYTKGSNIVSVLDTRMTDEFVGRYIWINGEWLKIIYVKNEKEAVVNKNVTASGTDLTMIVVMNEISIDGEGLSLTRFELEYAPCIR